MSDEENKDRKKKRNAGLDLIGESARKALEQQEEQRRELMEQVLGPNKALHDALGFSSIAKNALLGFDESIAFKAALGTDSIAARMAEITEFTDPLRNYRDAFENSSLARMQEQIRTLSETTVIGKLMADVESATAQFQDAFKFDLPTFPSFDVSELNALKMPEVPMYDRPSLIDYTPIHNVIEPVPPPEPGEAAKILSKLQDELDALKEEHANNPSKQPIIIVMLADGKEIYLQTARNIGDQTIELSGLEFGSGTQRELTVGIATASFYTDVLDIGPRKPELKVIEDDPEDE